MSVSRSVSNCVFVFGSKSGKDSRSTVRVGSVVSMTTAFAFVVAFLLDDIPTPAKRSSACLRSASCSVRRSLSRLEASSSSDSSSDSPAARRAAFAARRSSMRCAFVFLLAAASASAFAFFSAATLAFSRSTSLSSASSHASRTSWIVG